MRNIKSLRIVSQAALAIRDNPDGPQAIRVPA
jgi:hypothetical protein